MSIVNTQTKTLIGEPLITWPVYADPAKPAANESTWIAPWVLQMTKSDSSVVHRHRTRPRRSVHQRGNLRSAVVVVRYCGLADVRELCRLRPVVRIRLVSCRHDSKARCVALVKLTGVLSSRT